MPLAGAELEPFLRLMLVQGVGPQRLTVLLERFGSPEDVMNATAGALRSVPGIGPELTRRIRAGGGEGARHQTRNALRALSRVGGFALRADDPLYPRSFQHVAEPPVLLFGAGDPLIAGQAGVAIVGTRAPTRYGRNAAERLASDLARSGLMITSGLARGVDTAGHRGALAANGRTIGVLGHGIDQVYPSENHRLFAAIREKGLLLTEYPPGETPKAGNFPRRNRLIAALADAVVVVEMGHKSGAQHTVGFALEQGKEVMAVPGPIGSPASEGTNQLIKDGARLVSSAEDVLEELRGVGRAAMIPPESKAGAEIAPETPLLSSSEARLLQSLSGEPVHIDELASGSGVAPPAILATLLHLELRGLVTALPGKWFCRA